MIIGRIPIAQYVIDASNTTVTKSSGTPLQIDASLSSDVKAIEILSDLGAPVNLFAGPATALETLQVIGGYSSTVIHHQRAPILINKSARLSVQAVADTDITSGILIINLWG